MKLTDLEFQILKGIDDSDFGDDLLDDVWTWSVDPDGVAAEQRGGVIASLSKKGLVRVGDTGDGQNSEYVGMTQAGADAYRAHPEYVENKVQY